MEKKLYRSNINKKVAGICGGLSDYFEMDATIIRLIFVLLAIFGGGTGVIIYIVLWIVVPRSPYYLPFQQEPFVTPPPAGQPDMNEAKTAQEQQPIFDDAQPIKNRGSRTAGVILIVLGVIFLISHIFPFWDIIIPLIFVSIGIGILINNFK
ncbi:MAG: PspC domain-containing protein [Bacteroidota bacterium]|nr:PspC domain-containing protein [Bacteroidota bacterium]